jgi:hypothetical protein
VKICLLSLQLVGEKEKIRLNLQAKENKICIGTKMSSNKMNEKINCFRIFLPFHMFEAFFLQKSSN